MFSEQHTPLSQVRSWAPAGPADLARVRLWVWSSALQTRPLLHLVPLWPRCREGATLAFALLGLGPPLGPPKPGCWCPGHRNFSLPVPITASPLPEPTQGPCEGGTHFFAGGEAVRGHREGTCVPLLGSSLPCRADLPPGPQHGSRRVSWKPSPFPHASSSWRSTRVSCELCAWTLPPTPSSERRAGRGGSSSTRSCSSLRFLHPDPHP